MGEMTKKAKKPKIGRPSGRKPLLNLRIEPSLHDRLKTASAASGRTISEEAVRLIDYGLQSQNLLEQAINLAFGPEITGDLMRIGRVMQNAALRATSEAAGPPVDIADWSETPEVFDEVVKAIASYFEQRNPRGGILPIERQD
jgi:hypothetical protein